MIRTQISFDKKMYEQAKLAAKRRGVSLAELCRQAMAMLLTNEPHKQPWMAFAGKFEGEAQDSSSIDDVVYRRQDL